jgi:type IV pilus assembly protein PilN
MRIEINLLGEKKKRKGGGGFQLPDFAALAKQVKDPLLLGAIGAWVVAVVVIGFMFLTQSRTVAAKTELAEQTRQDDARYRTLIRQKDRSTALRDSLVLELDAIREIDADRFVWPHLLDEITKALPDYTWLTSVTALAGTVPPGMEADSTYVPPLEIQVEGETSDISAMTRFVRNLQLSPWVASVTIGPNTQVESDGQVVTAFSVTAVYQLADSSYIRTVPVAESVR